MYYHGSPIGDIKILKPTVTSFRNKEKARIYFSSQRANAVIYCTKCHMYPYGFEKETGLLQFDEPYENCLWDLYANRSGFLYSVQADESIEPMKDIRNGFSSENPIRVHECEFIKDIYERLLEYEERREIVIVRYENVPKKTRNFYYNWVVKTLGEENYFNSTEDYPMYLKQRFPIAWQEVCESRKQIE